MKKSGVVFLSLAFTAALAACEDRPAAEEDWVDGKEQGKYRDTVANGQHFRHYGGFWYPLVAGRIAPGLYQGATSTDIARPGFTPVRAPAAARSGGFGSRGRASIGG